MLDEGGAGRRQIELGRRLEEGRILLAPGISDALTALVAARAGAEALYLSGANIAYGRLGRPDVGLVTMSEVEATLSQIAERVDLPIIVDADTGFGNALNAARTVRTFEKAGAAAIQLEDQEMPKRCGHLRGKSLVAVDEMVGKVRAAVDARLNASTLVIARTDAIAVEGFAAALDRGRRYVAAGCDILFIEAPQSIAQMREIARTFEGSVPLLANMVEGGSTPMMTAADLEGIGFRLVIFPGGIIRALCHTAERYYGSLLAHGTNGPFREQMLDFVELNERLGTARLLDAAAGYDPAGRG